MGAYYLLLKMWSIFPDTEAWQRLPGVIAAALAVFFFHDLSRRLTDSHTAIVAVVLFASHGVLLRQAQEIRSYAFVAFFAVLGTWFFVRATENNKRSTWIGYTLVTAAGIYFHLLAAFIPLAHLFASLLRRQLRTHLTYLTLSVVLMLPWVYAAAQTNQNPWFGRPNLGSIGQYVHQMAGALYAVPPLLLASALILWAVGAWAIFRVRNWQGALVIAWLVLPAAASFLVSLVYRPMFWARYFIGCVPAACLLLALGIMYLLRQRATFLAAFLSVGVLFGMWGQDVKLLEHPGYEDWRGAAAFVQQRQQPGDVAVFDSRRAQPSYRFYDPDVPVAEPEGHNRVWLILSHSRHKAEYVQRMESRTLVLSQQFPKIEVMLWDGT